MSNWVSAQICAECWEKREPSRTPVRVITMHSGSCALCRRWTESGIFVRLHLDEEERPEWASSLTHDE